MDSKLDLNIYTHRGHLTKAETMRSSQKLKSDLQKLKSEMNYKDGTEILLAVSVVTDDMTRHVAMFPEVFYLDVTANTNKLKREIFRTVVKDSNRQTFIGNITVTSSGKWCVFQMSYCHFYQPLQ